MLNSKANRKIVFSKETRVFFLLEGWMGKIDFGKIIHMIHRKYEQIDRKHGLFMRHHELEKSFFS